MTDELKKAMTETFNSVYGNEVRIGLREAVCKIYLHGGEHGYQYAVERACEYFTHMKDCDFYEDKEAQKKAVDDFIDRFRKAMED